MNFNLKLRRLYSVLKWKSGKNKIRFYSGGRVVKFYTSKKEDLGEEQ